MWKKRVLSNSRESPMTLPDERYRAIKWAERFLQDIAHDKKKYPRIPVAVRKEAHSILRHYPGSWDMERAATACPEVFQKEMHPLVRMIAEHKQENINNPDTSKSSKPDLLV
jgi:hypothetical protein